MSIAVFGCRMSVEPNPHANPCLLRRYHSIASGSVMRSASGQWSHEACQMAPAERAVGGAGVKTFSRKASYPSRGMRVPPVEVARASRKAGSAERLSFSETGAGGFTADGGVGVVTLIEDGLEGDEDDEGAAEFPETLGQGFLFIESTDDINECITFADGQ
jgi:hypothetical protein